MNTMENEKLTIEEAAKQLKIHPNTLRRYVSEGKIKAIVIGGTTRIEQNAINSLSDSSD